MGLPEQAEERPRSEELRESFWRDGRWRLPGGGVLPKGDRDALMDQLVEEEQRAAVAKEEYDRKARASSKAREQYAAASGEYHKVQDRVDVLKLALADAIGVPK